MREIPSFPFVFPPIYKIRLAFFNPSFSNLQKKKLDLTSILMLIVSLNPLVPYLVVLPIAFHFPFPVKKWCTRSIPEKKSTSKNENTTYLCTYLNLQHTQTKNKITALSVENSAEFEGN